VSSRGNARGIAISTLGNAFPPIVGLVTAPLLAQHLGVEGRGLVAAATAPLLLATSIATLGLPEAVTYFVARGIAKQTNLVLKVALALTLTGAVSSGAIFLLSPALADGDSALASLIGLVSLAVVPSLLLALVRGTATGREFWWMITFERITSAGVRLALIVGLALFGELNVGTAAAAIALSSFVGLAVYLALPRALSSYPRRADLHIRNREIASFASRMWLGSLGGILLSRLDQTLMLPLTGAVQLGLYAVAATVSEMVLVFNSAVNTVTYASQSRENSLPKLSSAARVSTALTLAAAIGVGLLSIWAIPFFFGEEFFGAVIVTEILLVAVVIGNPGSVAGSGLSARGRPGLRSASLLIALLVNVAVLVVLAPTLGAIGAAIATLAGNAVAGWLNIIWLKAYFGDGIRSYLGIRKADLSLFAGVVSTVARKLRFGK
jgi:O-antigen/teichoic acid export membrane protein